MHGQAILATALPLVSYAIARPLESRDASTDITITKLSATFPSSGPYGDPEVDSFVTISVTYPDPAAADSATLSTTCTVSWPSGTDPAPTEWTDCVDPTLSFRLPTDGWTSTGNFQVELWETLTSDGAGLDAAHLLRMNPSDPSSADSLLWCQTYGKFTATQCTLSGPYGQTPRTVTISATEGSARPN
ncbi:hypothetical protein PFICI_00124 [Pestalotiopsis fici W106-1]|uniref:Ubiquitin 3 binding protein But2 C-terminal domain-containing protein n=1 Tax=Pestalotiopsis fici (strain W106-1 / CGMCC3.15140) TaxID=1229662 RepID=W3XM17_PESFW|nr:uncharacterized protein PFICI_00124 [Pestalotiopsis fici W106-1]ETS86296.1 hypothetical protein PFICI_00124 [Pestalotiopsis fici W106-1]